MGSGLMAYQSKEIALNRGGGAKHVLFFLGRKCSKARNTPKSSALTQRETTGCCPSGAVATYVAVPALNN